MSALAQQPSNLATIVGRIRVTRGNFPPVRVLVDLETRGARVSSIYADGEGQFAFEDLPGNSYRVIIREQGFVPVDVGVSVNPAIQHVVFVRIELTPLETDSNSRRDGESVAGSNPAMVDEAVLLKTFSKEAKEAYEKATRLQAKGKRREAIKHYEKALAIAPGMYFARNNLGSLYLEDQQFARAEAEFRNVLKDNQADANAYFNLANVCLLTKRLQEAREVIGQGMARQPTSAIGHFLLGSVMLQEGNRTEAEQHLRTALNADPELANAHLALVNLYLQEGRNGDAVTELAAFLKQSPESPFAPHARELLKKLQSNPSTSP
jgi:tetratricopeptide (TPR) repeat protein